MKQLTDITLERINCPTASDFEYRITLYFADVQIIFCVYKCESVSSIIHAFLSTIGKMVSLLHSE